MRIMNVNGRLALAVDNGYLDVATASDGPELGPPVPHPPQVFAIGLNYRAHAEEGGLATPESPMVFTKFPSSITGPNGEISLPPGAVDDEAELVVVIGRRLQLQPPAPQQFSLAKSFPGFSPLGPVLVTADELANPDDLEIACRLNGETLQRARTWEMIFGVPALIAYLSSILPLLPGDVIFTGTPDGVGFARDPQRLIAAGDTLETELEGIGTMRHTFAAP
jgi:2-keto-4-pentenoate hydratase/2-oxohepta-3-ene-1,7-dioic acid hydratase in catechol pathway